MQDAIHIKILKMVCAIIVGNWIIPMIFGDQAFLVRALEGMIVSAAITSFWIREGWVGRLSYGILIALLSFIWTGAADLGKLT